MVVETATLQDLLRRLVDCRSVVIHQYLIGVSSIDMLAAASPWQNTVLTNLGAEDAGDLFERAFEPHPRVTVAEISRYAAIRSHRRGIDAIHVSAGIWRKAIAEHAITDTASGPLKAIAIGRILPHKCFEVAIQAVGGNARLTIVGPSSSDSAYERYLDRLIESNRCVTRAGHVSASDRDRMLSDADVLIASSSHTTYEGKHLDQPELFGLVLLEAVACNTLPIASDIPSFREIMEDLSLSDWLYPERNSQALAGMLERLGSMDREARAERLADAHRRMKDMFLWDTYWDRLSRNVDGHRRLTALSAA
jgi:glycosyltransferase involved in cell wall biosynthesis